MAIFVTGTTGYLGSYVAAGLFTEHRDKLNLLVRAKSEEEARERLWASLQLHFEFREFCEYLGSRVRIFRGDLTSQRFGLPDHEYNPLCAPAHLVITLAGARNANHASEFPNVKYR